MDIGLGPRVLLLFILTFRAIIIVLNTICIPAMPAISFEWVSEKQKWNSKSFIAKEEPSDLVIISSEKPSFSRKCFCKLYWRRSYLGSTQKVC